MNARARGKWIDVGVTAVLLGVGLYGLVSALGFPERASIWPVSVMTLLVVATSIHLLLTLWGRGAVTDEAAEGGE